MFAKRSKDCTRHGLYLVGAKLSKLLFLIVCLEYVSTWFQPLLFNSPSVRNTEFIVIVSDGHIRFAINRMRTRWLTRTDLFNFNSVAQFWNRKEPVKKFTAGGLHLIIVDYFPRNLIAENFDLLVPQELSYTNQIIISFPPWLCTGSFMRQQ